MSWQRGSRLRAIGAAAPWTPWAPLLVLSLPGWALAVAATTLLPADQHAVPPAATGPAPLDWLLADRGPFHRAQDYADFMERYRQGFTTRYRIYR